MIPHRHLRAALAATVITACLAAPDAPAQPAATTAPAEKVELPKGATTLVEAEAAAPKSSVKSVEADGASGGKALESGREWEPVFESDKLAKLEGRVTVWVRHRGGPVQLKSVVGGEQTERDWSWASTEDFAWQKIGTYDAADLGERIILIRGQADGPVSVDCVAYSVEKPAGQAKAADTPQNAADAGIGGGGGPGLQGPAAQPPRPGQGRRRRGPDRRLVRRARRTQCRRTSGACRSSASSTKRRAATPPTPPGSPSCGPRSSASTAPR